MAFLDDLKKKANQTVQTYANSAEGQKRLSEYNASNAKKSTVSSVKNTVQKTFKPITGLASKAMPKMESNWYKGSKPTQRETLARIYEVGNQDPSKRDSLMQMYQDELNDPASPIYNPYTSATTTSMSKTNLNNTLKAQQEWAELSKELTWWAQHPSRNYSDDEIVARVNWKNYPTLAKMDDGRKSGSPLALTDTVGYSKDAMYGVLWAARNPNKSTGDYMLDAVQSVLGRGKQYQLDAKTANRLNPMSAEYNPYAVGSTMDELAYKYGVYSFDQEWLDNNRHLIANPDTNADYGKIYKAVQNTAAMNAEAQSFNNDVARLLEAGQPVDVDKIIERGEYSQLQKIRESLDSGQRIDTTAAIDFDPYLLQTDADAYLQQVTGDYTTDQYDQMLSDNMGGSYLPNESKQNSEELRKLNTDVNLPEYIPVATEPELRAFKTTANAGYSDVVYTTADLIANGTGGLAQANAAQQKAAHAFANKNLFDAWDAINDDVSFADAMPDDVAAFLQKYFPEKYEAGELPTMYEVATLDMSNHPGEDLNNVVATWNEMYEYAEAAMEDAAGRKEAADKARQTVADVMDDLAEVYGEGTEQYNAAVATYEMAYAYSKGVPKTWQSYDAFQQVSAQEGATAESLATSLTNLRGANARNILVLNALVENAEIIGIPEADIRNMRQQVEDLKTQNDLLAAHKLSSNEDYTSQVAAFDEQFHKADGMNLFGQKFSTHEDAVRQVVADPEYGFYSLNTDANPTEITMLAQVMTDEERNNYKYIYMTEGQERATAYFDALSENLYVRAAEERSERTQEWAAENELNSAIATVGSVFLTPMEAASALSMLVEFVQTGKVNPYGMNAAASRMKGDLRTGTKEGAKAAWGEENKVAYAIYSTVYDALTSAADSMVASKFGSIGGAAMMGASAFTSATMDASMRGASGERALLFGAASALIEAGSEKISIDRILGAFDSGASGVRGLLDEIAKGFFSEGAEEMASTLGSAIADDMIMGAMANRETAIAAYMEAGLTREEAEAQAAKDILTDIAYSGLVGGISGSFSSGLEYGRGALTGTTEQPVQATEETTQVTTKEAAPTGTPVQRAEAALSTAMQEGVGEVQQTATVSGVLQSFGLSGMEANAAAKNIVGATNIRVLRKMLTQADDPAGLIQAIAMGSVSERSRSWAILHNARVDSKNAKDIGDQLIAASTEDANDQSVMTEYDARVAFSAEADISAGVVVSGERRDRTALDDAVEKSKDAQREMDKAETGLESAHQAVVDAQNKFNENLNDKEAMLALKNAINLQYKARERSEAAKRNAILAKKHLDKANADFKAQTESNMIAAREQAKSALEAYDKAKKNYEYAQEAFAHADSNIPAYIRALDEAEAALTAAEAALPEYLRIAEQNSNKKKKEAKAAEQKRQRDNVAALDAKEFIDTNHPDATDDEQETLQKAYISLTGDIDTDVDTVYDSASKLHDGFASRVSSAVEGFGSFLDGGVKSKNSLKSKVLRKTREGREYSVMDSKDHVRGAVLLERGLEDVPAVIDRLKERFSSMEGEAFLTEPLNTSGYRGIHLSVTFENGLHGEIQMTTPEAWSIKKQTDVIYEKWRNVSLDSATPQQVAEYEADCERSSQLWESYYSGFTPEVIRMASASVMGLESQRSPKVPVALPQTPSENSSGNAENPDGIAYSFLPSYNENFQVLTNTTSDAIIAQKGGENQTEPQKYGEKQRQFTSQTLPNKPNIPQWAVDAVQQNPEAMNYEPDSNREQAQRGWQRLQENGYEAEVERLLGLERYTPNDVAEANIIMAMALREDTSDPATFFRLASDYAVKGTTAGQELQARKLFSKMTPNGIRVWVAGKLENNLGEYMRSHRPAVEKVNEAAEQVAEQIRNLQSGDELLRLTEGGDFTIDSSNNRWGVLINEQQQALIDHYKLNDVARPGIFYNRATTKQRMLEAILATPNPLEVTNLGLNLIQRLEFMQDGQAVVTNADLNYIGSRLGEFIGYGGDEGGRDADVAIARAYEAFGNITPASAMEKFRTQRYVNMLLSIPSFTRNIMGNAAQNALNAVSHGGAVLLDKAIASGTGRRTVDFLDAKDRIDGWKAFVEETKNTFRDYFIDKVNAAPNQDKYSTNRRARTFQNPLQEATKDLEAFLMSVGDRNVWKKAFVNSLAEQQKLADQNLLFNDDGTTLTHDQMVERAERDANYATFTEDNLVQHVVGDLARRSPVAADVLSLFVPFTGVPTNIMKRSLQYSPVGFLTAVGRVGYHHMRGQNFDQRAFVNDISRAFTGSALMLAGYMLGAAGMITMGSGDEDEGDKVYDAKTARGDQYTPYFYDPTTGTNVSMSTFAPAGSPLVWGASIGEALKGDENLSQIMLNALFSSTDSILNASYLSGLSDLFGGYGSLTENAIQVGAENLVSQSIPALFTQAANALDPYVRDTKDKDFLTGLLKTTVNRIPGLRNVVLPEKVTVTGETVPTRENRVSNFYDPFTRSARNDNAALAEAMRLYEAVGTTDVLPSDAVRGKKNSFSLKIDGVQMSVTLTDAQKAEYRKHYGKLWTEALDILMADPAYSVMTDEEKAGKVKKIMQNALKQAKTDFLLKYGQPAEE